MIKTALLLFFGLIVFSGCKTSSKVEQREPTPADSLLPVPKQPELYDVLYPQNNPAPYFKEFSELIKRIQVTLFYTSYYFDNDQRITPKTLAFQRAQKLSRDKHVFNFSKIGTAIPLQVNDDGVLLVTCAHVVEAPDTIYSYRKKKGLPQDTYLRSVTILERVEYYAFDAPTVNNFQVIAKAEKADVALIQSIRGKTDPRYVKTLDYPLGDSKKLQWGSPIFMFGFPINNRMMSTGIVSDPNADGKGSFLTNAYMNKGFSGGLIVALRGDVPNFEWVGIASAASSEHEFVIVPNKNQEAYFEEGQMYTDTLYLEKRLNINHGISKAVPTEEIRAFFESQEKRLSNLGYDLTYFYRKTP